MKECKVTIEQKGAFWLLRWNGKLIYKSKDEQKVRNREQALQSYAAKLNERKGSEK
jgi:hypothetical protein